LNLLKCQPQQIAELFLAHPNQHSPDTHAIADLCIYRIRLFFGHDAHTHNSLPGANLLALVT
jgi:hypothetical protein